MSKFWEYVSNVSDDIRNDVRHELVERPWYGAPTTSDNSLLQSTDEMDEAAPSAINGNELYEEVWGEEPEAEELYGEAPLGGEGIEIEPKAEPDIEQDV